MLSRLTYLLRVQANSLSQVYSSKTDEELIALASDPNALADEARRILADELSRRKITPSQAFLAERMPQERPTQPVAEFSAVLRPLKFVGALLINLAVAIIAITFLDTQVRSVIPTHTVAAILWKEVILSVLCAAFIGFFMWRTWRTSAAKWIRVPATLWFALGYATIARSGNPWGRLSGFSSESVLSGPDPKTFFAFTFPLIRSIFYSVGAYISSLMYHAKVSLSDGC